MAGQIIVTSMAFERFFVLNWPLVMLKAPQSRVRKVCLCIIVLSFLQFALVRGTGCYARGIYQKCLKNIYFLSVCPLGLVSSIAVYIRIYIIVRRKALALRQYRGTIVSFMYLVNSTCFIGLYLGLAAYAASLGNTPQWMFKVADSIYIVNCIIDASIYGLWFREVRMEILKIVAACFPSVKSRVEQMRRDAYKIAVCDLKEAKIVNPEK